MQKGVARLQAFFLFKDRRAGPMKIKTAGELRTVIDRQRKGMGVAYEITHTRLINLKRK